MNDEEEITCAFAVNASASDGNGDMVFKICAKASTRALACHCSGDLDAMISCYHWRGVFARERIAEALEQMSHCDEGDEPVSTLTSVMHG